MKFLMYLRGKKVNRIFKTFRGMTDYKGRSTRSELWLFLLFIVVATFLIGFVVFLAVKYGYPNLGFLITMCLMSFNMATAFALIPLGVRRLHDIGFSGFFLFLAFIPIVGIPALLVISLFDSKPGSNKYGKNPKGIGNLEELKEAPEPEKAY